jgi:hypothetical protein
VERNGAPLFCKPLIGASACLEQQAEINTLDAWSTFVGTSQLWGEGHTMYEQM